jgi:hypothetical protein
MLQQSQVSLQELMELQLVEEEQVQVVVKQVKMVNQVY